MRSFFTHAVAGCRNIQHVLWLCAFWIRNPILPEFAVSIFPKIARLRLRMAGIFQRVCAVRNANFINVESELFAFAKMNNAFVRTSPIAAEVRLVFIMPDNPAAALEEWHRPDFDISQNF